MSTSAMEGIPILVRQAVLPDWYTDMECVKADFNTDNVDYDNLFNNPRFDIVTPYFGKLALSIYSSDELITIYDELAIELPNKLTFTPRNIRTKTPHKSRTMVIAEPTDDSFKQIQQDMRDTVQRLKVPGTLKFKPPVLASFSSQKEAKDFTAGIIRERNPTVPFELYFGPAHQINVYK
jgi:hypothetical protein